MRYLKTKLATDWPKDPGWKVGLTKAILFFIPRANPGYDPIMHLLSEWFVEIDEENLPFREIGLDQSSRPIFAGTSKRNYGFWLDTRLTGDDFSDASEISKVEFEEKWSEYWTTCENDEQWEEY